MSSCNAYSIYSFFKLRVKTKLQSSVYVFNLSTYTYKYLCLYISVALHVHAHGPLHIIYKIIYPIKTTQDSQKLETLTEDRRQHSQFW